MVPHPRHTRRGPGAGGGRGASHPPERLGHLPLAEELAGRYLEGHPRTGVGAYVARLERVLTVAAISKSRIYLRYRYDTQM